MPLLRSQSQMCLVMFGLLMSEHDAYVPSRLRLHEVNSSHSLRIGLPTKPISKDQETTNEGASMNPLSLFESIVHQATGDSSYSFGDLTKKTISDLTGKDVEAEGYQFGDISKNLAAKAGQVITGDKEYEFGDITKSKLAELEKELEEWRNQNLNEVPTSFLRQTFSSVSPTQRREIIIGLVRLAAVALLSWGCVSNILNAGVVSLAWTRTSLLSAAAGTKLPLLPWMVGSNVWRTFVSSYATLKFFLDPLLLVIKGCGTLFAFRSYARCIATIEQKWKPVGLLNKYPLLYRAGALVTAFTLNSVIIPTAMLLVGLAVGSSGVRIWYRSFPITV